VERKHAEAVPLGVVGARVLRAADLGRPGEEHEDVPVRDPRREALQSGEHLASRWRVSAAGRCSISTGRRALRRRAPGRHEEPRHRGRVDGGRHHDHPELRAALAEAAEEGEAQVGGQVALVELVEDDGAHAPQLRVRTAAGE
jgi:hypothetical protein